MAGSLLQSILSSGESLAKAAALDSLTPSQEVKEDRFDEVPIFGADGEKGAEPKFRLFDLVNVEGGEIALAAGGNIEAQAEGRGSRVERRRTRRRKRRRIGTGRSRGGTAQFGAHGRPEWSN